MTYQFENKTWLLYDDAMINFDRVAKVGRIGNTITFYSDNNILHVHQYDSEEQAIAELEHIKDIVKEPRR